MAQKHHAGSFTFYIIHHISKLFVFVFDGPTGFFVEESENVSQKVKKNISVQDLYPRLGLS